MCFDLYFYQAGTKIAKFDVGLYTGTEKQEAAISFKIGILVQGPAEQDQAIPDPFIISKSRMLNKRVLLNVGGIR